MRRVERQSVAVGSLGSFVVAGLLQRGSEVVSVVGVGRFVVQRFLEIILRGGVVAVLVGSHARAVAGPAVHGIAAGAPDENHAQTERPRDGRWTRSTHGRSPWG